MWRRKASSINPSHETKQRQIPDFKIFAPIFRIQTCQPCRLGENSPSFRGYSLVVKLQPSKLARRVRFPLPAPFLHSCGFRGDWRFKNGESNQGCNHFRRFPALSASIRPPLIAPRRALNHFTRGSINQAPTGSKSMDSEATASGCSPVFWTRRVRAISM